jgi:hypothetical protein
MISFVVKDNHLCLSDRCSFLSCRGKSMLAQSVMTVVFVPGEVISQGSLVHTGLTAGKTPKFQSGIWCEYLESATVTESVQK